VWYSFLISYFKKLMQKHFPEGILRIFLMQVADGASTCFRNLFNGLRDRPVKQGCSMHTNGKTKWSINVSGKRWFWIRIMLNFLKVFMSTENSNKTNINTFNLIYLFERQSFAHMRIILYKYATRMSIKFKLAQIKINSDAFYDCWINIIQLNLTYCFYKLFRSVSFLFFFSRARKYLRFEIKIKLYYFFSL